MVKVGDIVGTQDCLPYAKFSKATIVKFDTRGGPETPSPTANFAKISQGDLSLRGIKFFPKILNFHDLELLKTTLLYV